MRDIEGLRELREYDAGAPPLDDATRGRVRVRLFAAMNAESGPAPAARHRRPVLRIALTAAVATAVVGGLVVAGQGHGSGAGQTAAPPEDSSPVMGNVSAQTVLAGAATYAQRHEQAAHPRNDQFLYTKEIIKETNERTGVTKSYTDENWRSVDDSKPSWIMEVGKGWWSPPAKDGETVWPPQDWASLERLPTDPTKLILSLVGGYDRTGKGSGPLGGISDLAWSSAHFDLVGLLKLDPVMPQGLRPAAFKALGMIPGVKAVPNRKDAKGRTGVAITYDDPILLENPSNYFLFDPKTYAFLGFRDEDIPSKDKGKDMITQLSYLDSWAIVDKAKQRP